MNWKLLTIGCLTRNKFWRESDLIAYRPVLATTTLIRDGNTCILVDPSLPVQQMDALLRRHAGIGAGDIRIIYITHYHADHRVDAECYENAVCCISEGTLADMRAAIAEHDPQAPAGLSPYTVVRSQLTERISLLPLPGHTAGLTGLAFDCGGQRVLVTGDAVMDEDFFRHAEGYWFDKAPGVSAETIRRAAARADIIIPGHGDWFRTDDPSLFRCRRLRTDDSAGAAHLILHGSRRFVVDPFLPGPAMIQALFRHSGLYPVEIDGVIFTKAAPQGNIAALFRNAKVFFPGDALPEGLTDGLLSLLMREREEPNAR